jgi:hypothetical protein
MARRDTVDQILSRIATNFMNQGTPLWNGEGNAKFLSEELLDQFAKNHYYKDPSNAHMQLMNKALEDFNAGHTLQ